MPLEGDEREQGRLYGCYCRPSIIIAVCDAKTTGAADHEGQADAAGQDDDEPCKVFHRGVFLVCRPWRGAAARFYAIACSATLQACR
jgi:hypothetical protein